MRKPQDNSRVYLGSTLGGTVEWPSDREAEPYPTKVDRPAPETDSSQSNSADNK